MLANLESEPGCLLTWSVPLPLNHYQGYGTDLSHFSQAKCLLMFRVRSVKARIHSVSCSLRTWRMSYSQCTLLRPLLSHSLLLSNGRGFASCTLFNDRGRDGRWGRFTSLELYNPCKTTRNAVGRCAVLTQVVLG